MRGRLCSSSSEVSSCRRIRLGPGLKSLALMGLAIASLLLSTPALVAQATEECSIDQQGTDDVPGQKDLTEFCQVDGDGIPHDTHVSWNLDDTFWSGNNEGEACALYDTDGNGFANYALCVTVEDGPPATQTADSPTLHLCSNDSSVSCGNNPQDVVLQSMCSVNGDDGTEGIDPFIENFCDTSRGVCSATPEASCSTDTDCAPSPHTGNACKGEGCLEEDTIAVCWIDFTDFGLGEDGTATLTDVCTYPAHPGSAPSDCIEAPTAGNDPCAGVDCSADNTSCGVASCDPTGEPGNCSVLTPIAADTLTECREAAGMCDVAEFCDGTDTECPADGFSTGVCRPATDICDVPEFCSGDSVDCPSIDVKAGTDIQCRAGNGVCDPAEFCDGNGFCAEDLKASTDVQCRAGNGVCDPAEFCDGNGSCAEDLKAGTDVQCRAGNGVCDPAEFCDGNGACAEDLKAGTDVQCRDANGVCDPAEFCDGDGACAEDSKAGTDVQCRDANGVCDPAEFCDGDGACAEDLKAGTDVQCRAANGVCDPAEFCDGDGACAEDLKAGTDVQCRDANGVCDPAEFCDGNGACAEDLKAGTDVQCRAANGVCDPAEFCDGDGACAEDSKAGTDVQCRDANGVCDPAEFCDGDGACAEDLKAGTDVQCRAANGVCDPAEFCDGDGACAEDLKAGTDVQCRDANGVCDPAEFCDGNGSCAEDLKAGTDVQCRDANGVCDPAEFCDGNGACAEDLKAGTDVQCRDANGFCDPAEFCDGDGACAEDVFKPSGTACDDTVDDCYAAQCDGSGSCDQGAQCDPSLDPDKCFIEIGDFVFNDENRDAVQSGDSGIDGVDISVDVCDPDNLSSSVALPVEVVSAIDGSYGTGRIPACDATGLIVSFSSPGGDWFPTVPNIGDDTLDSDCGPTGVVDCQTYSLGTDNTVDCGFYQQDEVCRTPGFWGTHPDDTYYVLNHPNVGAIDVCGETVTALESHCVAEGICVNGNDKRDKLARDLLSMALNCEVGGFSGCDGSSVEALFDSCNLTCVDGDRKALIECSQEVDCYNNGGSFLDGVCYLGTCSAGNGEDACVDDDSCAAEVCLGPDDEGNRYCSVNTGTQCGEGFDQCPLAGNSCVPFGGNCHDQSLSESPLYSGEPGTLGTFSADPSICNDTNRPAKDRGRKGKIDGFFDCMSP